MAEQLRTDDEKQAGVVLDLRTARMTPRPTPKQWSRHIALYGAEGVGYCQALYEKLDELGAMTPTSAPDAAQGE
jgi:hypothetical protein